MVAIMIESRDRKNTVWLSAVTETCSQSMHHSVLHVSWTTLWFSDNQTAMSMDTNRTTEGTGQVAFSCYHDWEIGIATFSAITFVTNIFHLIIISRMRQLQGRPYRSILIHITLADIGSSLFLLAFYSCLPRYYSISESLRGFPFVTNAVEWPMFTSHWIFLVAGIEQYYSICRPLLYESSRFIAKLPLMLVLTWVLSFCWSVERVAIPVILRTLPDRSLTTFELIDLLVRYIPLILAAVPLTLVVMELMRMRQMVIADDRKQSRRAATFVIIIYSLFMTFSLFDLIMSSIVIFDPTLISFTTLRLRNITKCLYGIIDIVIYGYRNKAYQREIRRLIFRQE